VRTTAGFETFGKMPRGDPSCKTSQLARREKTAHQLNIRNPKDRQPEYPNPQDFAKTVNGDGVVASVTRYTKFSPIQLLYHVMIYAKTRYTRRSGPISDRLASIPKDWESHRTNLYRSMYVKVPTYLRYLSHFQRTLHSATKKASKMPTWFVVRRQVSHKSVRLWGS
jgi:hypothetical protein